MHGAGNDFVMINNLDGEIELSTEQIAFLCDRHFGVGGDGLILLEKAPAANLDAQMVYFNADGSRAEMCGNGARCFTSFAMAHSLENDSVLRFRTDAGDMTATAQNDQYTVQLTPAVNKRLNIELELEHGHATVHYLDTGVPHIVKFVLNTAAVDIKPEGSELRFHKEFAPKGANANFAHLHNDKIMVRTYERGVEDETLACGTGVTAVAILAHLVHKVEKPIRLQVAGGDFLTVDFTINDETIDNITLTGPAKAVYSGTIEVR